jgi:hypothetical protein
MSDHDQPVAANLLDRQFTAEDTHGAVVRFHNKPLKISKTICFARRAIGCIKVPLH